MTYAIAISESAILITTRKLFHSVLCEDSIYWIWSQIYSMQFWNSGYFIMPKKPGKREAPPKGQGRNSGQTKFQKGSGKGKGRVHGPPVPKAIVELGGKASAPDGKAICLISILTGVTAQSASVLMFVHAVSNPAMALRAASDRQGRRSTILLRQLLSLGVVRRPILVMPQLMTLPPLC